MSTVSQARTMPLPCRTPDLRQVAVKTHLRGLWIHQLYSGIITKQRLSQHWKVHSLDFALTNMVSSTVLLYFPPHSLQAAAARGKIFNIYR